jgi:cellulose synthase/poly-beta-1,6-N-acetylglucosamine synthase-like glycosyltransferase
VIILTALLALVALVLALPTLSDLVSLARAAGRRGRRLMGPVSGELPRIVFLVPAHDEEVLIAHTVTSLRAQDYPVERRPIVVIADNCSDRTADIAAAAGASVLVRQDTQRRGKPYALQWALRRIPIDDYDAVVVVDADAVVDVGYARALAAAGPLHDKACQTFNDVRNQSENALTRMAAVFSAARAKFINALKHRVEVNVPLANGLCLGREVVRRHGWNALSICEDWEMYALLTLEGERIENVPAARVSAQEARSLAQSSSQRKRWAAGKITVLAQLGPRLLRARSISPWQKLDVLAELTAPGPVVHAAMAVLLGLVALALPGTSILLALLGVSVVRVMVYAILGLSAVREPARALLAFAYLPLYAVWRLGVQVSALKMVGEKPWVRTGRHAPHTP